MATKEAQINLRLPTELDEWVSEQAGGSRRKPAYIRDLIERERARIEELELQAMFDSAWESLTDSEREAERRERELWAGGYSGRVGS
jgi:predicted DNA-binding protein